MKRKNFHYINIYTHKNLAGIIMIVIYCFRILNDVCFNNHNHDKQEKTKPKKLTYFLLHSKTRITLFENSKPIFINNHVRY